MKKYIIANLKMYLAKKTEADYWTDNFKKSIKKVSTKHTEIIICPPSIFVKEIIDNLKNIPNIFFGLQNCFWENEGSYTGEISPSMISSIGAKFVILGHSERRRYLKENSRQIALKIKQVLKNGLKPILCIGETAEEKQKELTIEIIKNELKECLSFVNPGKIEDVIICYEPIWAISSNDPKFLPNSNELMGIKLLIRKILTEKYGNKLAEKVAIIYGGSVDDKNVNPVCLNPEMNGVLIGKNSALPNELIKIAQIIDSADMPINYKNIKNKL